MSTPTSGLTKRRMLAAGLLLAAVLPVVGGCQLGVRTRSAFGGQLKMGVRVDERANDVSPVAVDLLLVYDDDVLGQLMGLTAADWFVQYEDLQRDHPGAFSRWRWEWVPGQDVGTVRLPLRARARAGLLFARYEAPGPHRARFDPHHALRLVLREDDFEVQPW